MLTALLGMHARRKRTLHKYDKIIFLCFEERKYGRGMWMGKWPEIGSRAGT